MIVLLEATKMWVFSMCSRFSVALVVLSSIKRVRQSF
jgi:hypothetical protein